MPDPTGPRAVRLRLEDVLDPDEEVSPRALLLVLADELLASAGVSDDPDARTRALAQRLRTLTRRGDRNDGPEALWATRPNALGGDEDKLLEDSWGATTGALAWVQALAERLVPIIAQADGQPEATVAAEIRARADEISDMLQSGGRLGQERQPLARWGPDPLPGGPGGE